jgi:hypothetical protein
VKDGATIYGDGVLAVSGNVVFCQIPPFEVNKAMGTWRVNHGQDQFNLRRTFGRTSFAVSRLLANLGVSGTTPLLERFGDPAGGTADRCLEGLYITRPTEWDDPYRFFGW